MCSLVFLLYLTPGETSFPEGYLLQGSGIREVSAGMRQSRLFWDLPRAPAGVGQGPRPRPLPLGKTASPSTQQVWCCRSLENVCVGESTWSGRPAFPQVPLLTQDKGGGRRRAARVGLCDFQGGWVWKWFLLCLLRKGRRPQTDPTWPQESSPRPVLRMPQHQEHSRGTVFPRMAGRFRRGQETGQAH